MKNKTAKLLKELYTRGFKLEPYECYCWPDVPTPESPCRDKDIAITIMFSPKRAVFVVLDCYEKGEVFLHLGDWSVEPCVDKYYILGNPGEGSYKKVNKVSEMVALILEFVND